MRFWSGVGVTLENISIMPSSSAKADSSCGISLPPTRRMLDATG
jgi:hypothetical protein